MWSVAEGEGVAHGCPRLSTLLKAHLSQSLLQAQRKLCTRESQRRKAFRKDFTRAGALFAEETTHLHHQMNETATGCKITQGPPIMAVYTFRKAPTTTAGSRWGSCTGGNH